MTLTLILVLAMFFISSNGQMDQLSPEQDVKCGEKCEYPQSCSTCFEDIADVILLAGAGNIIYNSHSVCISR